MVAWNDPTGRSDDAITAAAAHAPPARPWHPRTVAAVVRDFYTQPGGPVTLVVCALVLAYGGGAAMFWFHALYLGEGGPAISPWLHWALDSTAGFVGLTPAIAVILPLALRSATVARSDHQAAAVAQSSLAGGVALALLTAPAPLLHDRLIGRGTWLADHVTRLLGNGHHPTGEPQEVGAVAEMAQQVGAGVPTYVLLTAVGLLLARALTPTRWCRGAWT